MKKRAFAALLMPVLFLFAGCAGFGNNGGNTGDNGNGGVVDDGGNNGGNNGGGEVPAPVEYTRSRYSNPLKILRADGTEYFVTTADPDILYGDDGYYYMYPTNCECEMGDKGMTFDRGPVFRSKDCLEWSWCGSVFAGHPDAGTWGSANAGVWGPSVVKIGNKYNYYYSLSSWGDDNPGIGVATSDTPYGPWTHYGKILDQKDSGVRNGIDPKVVVEDDGVYLIWGSFFGIGCTLLTDDGLEAFYAGPDLKDHVTYIIADNTSGGMDIDINYEGSYIIKRDGWYYFFGSQGTCLDGMNSTYNVKVGKSKSLFGPYVDGEGKTLAVESYGDLVVGPSEEVAGTGHNAVFQDAKGEWWILYHGFYGLGEHSDERSLFIDKLLWDENGMPYVEGKVANLEEQDSPWIIK